MSILDAPRYSNGMIHPSVSLSSMGINNFSSVLLTEDWNVYDQGIYDFLSYEAERPSIYKAACDEHGQAHIENFINRCAKYVDNRRFISMKEYGKHVGICDVFLSCIQKSRIAPSTHRIGFRDRSENLAYQIFTEAAAFDAATIMASGWEYEVTHERCVRMGISFIDGLHPEARKAFKSGERISLLHSLHLKGVDVIAMQPFLIANVERIERYSRELFNMLSAGIPMEYAVSALDNVRTS